LEKFPAPNFEFGCGPPLCFIRPQEDAFLGSHRPKVCQAICGASRLMPSIHGCMDGIFSRDHGGIGFRGGVTMGEISYSFS